MAADESTELTVAATSGNLETITAFINQQLAVLACTAEAKMQIDLAVEEIYVNIARYAYGTNCGNVTIRYEIAAEPLQITIVFSDEGRPYNPLLNDTPDITLEASKRKVGGLGIFMTKTLMDKVEYVYKDGKNILTMKKQIT